MKNRSVLLLYAVLIVMSACATASSDNASNGSVINKYTGEISYQLEDSLILNEFFAKYGSLEAEEILPCKIAEFFLDVPYVGGTLENPEKEILVVNLRQLDCTTLVDNVMALYYTLNSKILTWDNYINNLIMVRYRDSDVRNYVSRFHYAFEGLSCHVENNRMINLSTLVPEYAVTEPLELSFMSTHPNSYPALVLHPEFVDSIRTVEQKISADLKFVYMPKDGPELDKLFENSIVAFVTSVKGLDISHLGLAYPMENGKYALLHASSRYGKVIISDVTIQEYAARDKSIRGIIPYRLMSKEDE